jgi:hypothetical protein
MGSQKAFDASDRGIPDITANITSMNHGSNTEGGNILADIFILECNARPSYDK